jgi:endonuclease-3
MIEIEKILKIFEQQNPNPQIELDYVNHYTLLVAVVLSAQSTDINVNKATKALFKTYDTPEKMLLLGQEGLKLYIKSIGLYNNKAKNIIALSQQLIEEYASIVPNNLDDLTKLPGVGRKSANVVLANAFGMPTFGVDTHVTRVANRLRLSFSNNPDKIEQDLLKVIAPKWLPRAHHWFVLHGRYTCKAIKPNCGGCPIWQFCAEFSLRQNKGRV